MVVQLIVLQIRWPFGFSVVSNSYYGIPRGKYITICLLGIPSRLSKQQKSKWPPYIQNGLRRAGGINFLLTGADNFGLFHPVVFFSRMFFRA